MPAASVGEKVGPADGETVGDGEGPGVGDGDGDRDGDGVMDEEYLFWDNQNFMKQIGLVE